MKFLVAAVIFVGAVNAQALSCRRVFNRYNLLPPSYVVDPIVKDFVNKLEGAPPSVRDRQIEIYSKIYIAELSPVDILYLIKSKSNLSVKPWILYNYIRVKMDILTPSEFLFLLERMENDPQGRYELTQSFMNRSSRMPIGLLMRFKRHLTDIHE